MHSFSVNGALLGNILSIFKDTAAAKACMRQRERENKEVSLDSFLHVDARMRTS